MCVSGSVYVTVSVCSNKRLPSPTSFGPTYSNPFTNTGPDVKYSKHNTPENIVQPLTESQVHTAYLVGARVEHKGLAFILGVSPSTGRDTRPDGQRGPQPGQHGRQSPALRTKWWRYSERE